MLHLINSLKQKLNAKPLMCANIPHRNFDECVGRRKFWYKYIGNYSQKINFTPFYNNCVRINWELVWTGHQYRYKHCRV